MSERGQVRAGLGVPSMVLVLVVLCLSMLGVLSLISARNDAALAQRHAVLTAAYDEAATAAQRALCDLDAQLCAAWRSSEDAEQYEAASMQVSHADCAPVEWEEQTAVLRFDAGYDRELVVRIRRCTWEEAAQKRFMLIQHTLQDTLEWEQTDGLHLMGV